MASLSLPLIWMLEKQAHFDQSDVNVLLGLLGMIPNITDGSCRNVRELVALRMLEALCLEEGFEGPDSSAGSERVIVDTSESCENLVIEVFLLLKQEDSHRKLSQLDLRRFIEHKRSVLLSGSNIAKLEDAIHTGCISLSSFSQKRSGLLPENQPEHGCQTDDQFSFQYLLDQNLMLANRKRKLLDIRQLKMNSLPRTEGLLLNEKQTSQEETEVLNENADHDSEPELNGSGKVLVSDETIDGVANDSQNAGDDHWSSEISHGINGCLADIDAKKKLFLSSYSTLSKDTSATTWRELKICMKCKEGGELLICSNISCPIVFHKRCLGLGISFEPGESFYCMFCDFARGLIWYQGLQKHASLARSNLQLFYSHGAVQDGPKRKMRTSGCTEQARDNRGGVADSINRSSKENFPPSVEQSSHEHKHAASSESQKCEEEDGKSSAILTDEKQEKKITRPLIPSFRKPKRWTSEEEEALLDGMRVIWKGDESYIPWKRILEHGAGRFHPTRTPVDLKDKWRNLCKGDQHPLLKQH